MIETEQRCLDMWMVKNRQLLVFINNDCTLSFLELLSLVERKKGFRTSMKRNKLPAGWFFFFMIPLARLKAYVKVLRFLANKM